jgi:HK97 family phage major capsid protein
MDRWERAVKGLESEIQKKLDENDAVLKTAKDDGDRDLTESEREEITENVRLIRGPLKSQLEDARADLKSIQESREIGRELGPMFPTKGVEIHDPNSLRVSGDRTEQHVQGLVSKSLGQEFVSSKGYRDAIEEYKGNGGRFREGFAIPSVSLDMKGTLLEGAGGGGGALAATVPQVVPGNVERLFQQLTVSDLLLQGQASTNSLRYVVEGTATSGAAGVAEGGTKPESTVGMTTVDEPIKKIATFLPVSEEMLEDAPAIQSYINGRLALFVRIEEERQLIRGAAGGNEVQGLLTSRNVPVYAGGTAAGNRAEQVFKAMNGMRGSAFVEPDWVIMNPADWEAIRLTKDSAGQYLGGGPMMGQYGNGGQVGASNQLSADALPLWNKPVYVTAAVGAGTAVVGSQASGQVWRRGGLSVDASNSHSNFFQLNLVAIRAEERVGLAVYRPNGFVEVRLA